jgi:hypothetical protein
MSDVETQKYTITGLVDIFDEQGNIVGQYPIGSVQELPVEFGDAAVEDGRAEVFGEVEEEETPVVEDEPVSDDELDEALADLPGADDDLDLDLEDGADEVE